MGYIDYSMSVNAYECYEKGIMPKGKWTKQEMLNQIRREKSNLQLSVSIDELKKLRKEELQEIGLYYDSWHHTSSYFNKTDFYGFNASAFEEITSERIKEIIKERKPKEESQEPQEIKARCKYLEWGGTRKHPKAIEHEAIGIIKGNWFFLENGKKKSINANGFEILEEIKK